MMKKLLFMLHLGLTVALFGQNNPQFVENEIIVKFKPNNSQSEELLQKFETPTLSQLEAVIEVSQYQLIAKRLVNSPVLIKFDTSDYSVQQAIAMYEATGMFTYVEPNYLTSGNGVPNDAEYYRQWSLKNDGTFPLAPATSGADIEMEPAWDIETGDPNMIVAIADSGMRLTHPEISNRIWINSDEVLDGTDTDGNGFIDDVSAGWDFINDDNDPTDDHGHGTNVGGIALATGDNSIGYAGVNWNSQIMVCKALNSNNTGTYSAMAGSIYYAVDNGAKVINMSIGGSSASSTLSDAIDYCYNNGVVLVACMMNFNNSVSYYPAAYDRTIAVGSTDPDDTRSDPFFWSPTSGSNFGNHIDVVAPGNYMYGLDYNSDTNYNTYWGGTSQATPLVAGVVSLLLAQNPSLTYEQVRTVIRDSAEDQVGDPGEDSPGFDIYYGYGRLNAYNALMHPLSVGDISFDEDVLLYPNPAERSSPLEIANLSPGEEYEITIYNIFGQALYNMNLNTNGTTKLSLPPFEISSGVYFLKIHSKKKNSSLSKKLIVK